MSRLPKYPICDYVCRFTPRQIEGKHIRAEAISYIGKQGVFEPSFTISAEDAEMCPGAVPGERAMIAPLAWRMKGFPLWVCESDLEFLQEVCEHKAEEAK